MSKDRGKCILCGGEAVRSIAASKVMKALGGQARLSFMRGKVGLCRGHYKLYKKEVKAEREVELARWKRIYV